MTACFLCSSDTNLGHRRRMETGGFCVFRRDNRVHTKCPACSFARRFPFAILSWRHQQIIPRHWLSDETHECVIAMLRFIIPFGPCIRRTVWAVFKWGRKQRASQCFLPWPYTPTNINTSTLSIHIIDSEDAMLLKMHNNLLGTSRFSLVLHFCIPESTQQINLIPRLPYQNRISLRVNSSNRNVKLFLTRKDLCSCLMF